MTGRPTSTKQVFTLQLLRALAAILVILTHSSSAAIHLDFGAIGVDIFFAISGIVMILSTVKLRKQADAAVVFLRRRVVRIVPMYWLFTLLAVIVEVALSRRYGAAVGKHYTAIEVLRSLFFLGKAWPVLIVGWTLNFEAFFYVCFAFFLWIHRSPFYLAPIFFGLTLWGMFAPQVPFNVFGFANYRLLQFVAGMVIGSLWLKGRLLPGWLAGIVCSVAVLAVVMRPHDTTWVHMMIWAPASVAFVYAILSFESILARHKWALLDLLADASYTIYLSHVQLTQSILHHLLKRLPQTSGHLGIGVAVATINVVVCCGVGVLIHIAVERPLLHRFGAPIGGHPKA